MGAIYGSSYYTIVEGPAWTQAEANAVSLGGHLATIGKESEQIFLSNNFISNAVPVTPASSENIVNNHWIGLTDKDQEGVFKWISGEEVTYTNWALREPNNHNNGENYVHLMYLDERGKGVWNDSPNGPVSRSWSTYVEKGIAEIPLSYFSIANATLREGKSGDVTITRTGGTTTSQTLKIISSDGSATLSNDDYAQVNKTVTFAAGETSKTINISTTADLNIESDESFSLTMTAEGSDDVPPQITDGSATVTIKADDFQRGNSLYTIAEGSSWTEAENEAQRLGGNLVTINSEDENNYLSESFVEILSIPDAGWGNRLRSEAWIGLNQESTRESRKWSSNKISSYSNIAPGQDIEDHGFHVGFFLIMKDPSGHAERHFGGLRKWSSYRVTGPKYQGHLGSGLYQGIAEIPIGGTPTYSIALSTSSIDEKSQSSVRFNISTTDVDANTRLYYTLSGSDVTASDFTSGDIKSSRLIGSDGKATFVLSAAADKTTEDVESFNIKLFSDFQRTNLVTTSSPVSIADTSKTPTPTYSIAPSASSIDEKSQSSVRFNISTTDVDTNTRLYYTLSGSEVTASDFLSGDIKSSRLIGTDGKATFVLSAAADKTTEEDESFNIKLYSDFQRTNLVATSSSVSIDDTSKTPIKTPTYSLSLSPSSIDEGDSLRASISTENVKEGTKLYYAIKGDVDADDFNGKSSLTGNVTIDSSGNASFTSKTLADKLTEGSETARILLFSDQQRTLQVGDAASASISDTSKSPAKAAYSIAFSNIKIQEGDIFTSTIATKNIDPGTRLYWNLSGTGVNTSDFSSGSLKGSSAIDKSGEFTLTHALAEDKITEGSESLKLQLFSDSSRNTLLTQKKIDIADTSITQQSASLRSASVNASTLNLSFDSSLDNTKPNHNRFSITADGKSISISSSSLDADAGSLKLNLASAIKPNQTVKLTYNDLNGDQSSGVLQTPNGTDLSSFSTAVSNNSSDSTAPTVTGATINGKVLSLSFDEVITKAIPSNRSWTLREDGKAISISSASVDSSSAQLDLTLSAAVDRGSNITLSYSDISGDQKANVIQDLAGNDLASFTNFSVENQTTRSSDPLDLNTAEINGNEIVLAFNRELSSTTPSKGTFRLRANNKEIKVKSITLSPNDREAVLNIASPVAHGDNVTLSYTDAQGNQKSNVIEDVDGNDLGTISNFKLTNNTRKSATNFEVDYADADGKIINVYLTDSLSSSIPKASLFRVTADKRKQKISSISTSQLDGIIILKLSKSINPKQDILISYRDLKGNQLSGVAEDTDGNDLASFKNLSPINDTSGFDEITDNNPPSLEDAYLDGKELILEFDKTLQIGKVSPSRFKLRAGKKRVRVASALVPQDDNSTAIVTLKYPLAASANSLTLAYKDLRGDQSSNIIQDDSGNDLASLRNFNVEII